MSPHRTLVLNVDRGSRGRMLLRSDDCASQAFPVIEKVGHMFQVDRNIDLVLRGDKLKGRLTINALPDARILLDEDGKSVIHKWLTIHYPHGASGDALESRGIAIFSIGEDLLLLNQFEFSTPFVSEGLAPLWFAERVIGVGLFL